MFNRPIRFTRDQMKTPVGTLLLLSDQAGQLRALDFEDFESRLTRLLRQHYRGAQVVLEAGAAPRSVVHALEAYFSGELQALNAIAVATGGTAFQRAVWAALRTIPAGTTLSYGALAAQLGNPRAVRAVGLANGANPIGIVVPCHRVIGANSSLTGYAGGLARKRWLLEHEGALPVSTRALAVA